MDIYDDEGYAWCVFEGGPYDGKLELVRRGQTVIRCYLELTNYREYSNLDQPVDAVAEFLIYNVVEVRNHPTSCRLKGVLK